MTDTAGVADDRATLASIVGDAGYFLDEVFGHRPWRGATSADIPFNGVPFGIDDLDAIVSSAARVPAIRMVRDGKRVPASEFCSPTRIGSTTLRDTADARLVLDQFRRGATLVLQSLQRTWPPMIEWCCSLERELGWPVQANAYLTPPGQPGLDRHADGHDVLAVQLHGAKDWDVEVLGPLTLSAGEVLYLPAGTEHQASTADQPSLHLTIGIHRPHGDRWSRTAFEIALERAGTGEVGRLADELRAVDGAEVERRLRRPPRVPTRGLVADSIRRSSTAHSAAIRPRVRWNVHNDGRHVALSWDDQRLRLPVKVSAALSAIEGSASGVIIADLPGLDADEQLVLARRLLDERAVVLADVR